MGLITGLASFLKAMDTDNLSNIPLSGRLVNALLSNFCQRPIKGDDTWEHCSIGRARNSIVATDSNSAVMIGEPADNHVATQRKEAMSEAARALIYGDPVRLDVIDLNLDDKSEPRPMPHVPQVIRQHLGGMKSLAHVNPAALMAIGKLAAAAGADSVELFQRPGGEGEVLGFKFTFQPDVDHVTLFTTWDGPIYARGVFKTVAGLKSSAEDDEDAGEAGETAAAPERASKKKKLTVAAAVAELPGETEEIATAPELPIDLAERVVRDDYRLPPLSALAQHDINALVEPGGYDKLLLEVLRQRGLVGRITGIHAGPTITQYELDVPANQSVKKIVGMADDIQMQLAVKSVRIEAPIPGKKAIGIEIPNKVSRMVLLSELCAARAFLDSPTRLLMALGLDIAGRPVYADLSSTPHLLIAGATNSGKSIGIAGILTSLILRNTPKDMRLVLIDPKQVELSLFEGLPHLMCPVITNVQEVPGVLRALVREMERRYEQLKKAGVRNIASYSAKAAIEASALDAMPFIVTVIDELADLMMQCPDVEQLIVRLAQKARAVGIHLVVATQRPSADIVTGLIKANVPSRIAFSVASQIDSRVILDQGGAEKLLGRGDMLFRPIESGEKSTRVQGAYVSEDEVAAVCAYWRGQSVFELAVLALDEDEPEAGEDEGDELYSDAVRWATTRGQCSTSMLQRQFSIGFQRASKLLDLMERNGIVGPRVGVAPREVIAGEAVNA